MNAQVLPMFLQNLARTETVETRMQTECELVGLAAAGDLAAFKQIYRLYSPRVFSLCRRIVNNPAEAEILTQTVFVELHKNLKRANAIDLSRCLRALAVNQILHRFFETESNDEQPRRVEARLFDSNKSLQQKALDGFDCADLEIAVARLPFDFRLIFVLHDFERIRH